MHKVFLNIVVFLLSPFLIFAQDVFTIHSSRDKTTLLDVEKLGTKFFVFFHDSTFLDKRIKCKVFDKNNPGAIKEFYITPGLFTFQDGLKVKIISDKLIFLSFVDYRNDPDGDIYSQLIDENGILWDSLGIPICVQKGAQKNINLSSDAENVFVVWEDYRLDAGGDIFAQKLDLFGNIHWKENGVVVSNVEGPEKEPDIAADNSGGCYVSWIEKILKINKVYVQYLDKSGKKLFGQFGIYVSNPEASSIQNFLITDESNEPIIFHTDKKLNSKIYFQKLSKRGTKKLGQYGQELCSKTGNQELIDIKKIGSGGFAILFSIEEKLGLKTSFLQLLTQEEKIKFKSPIKINNECKFHQLPGLFVERDGFFIYWTCHIEENDVHLFIQTISLKGEILKLDGLKLNDQTFSTESRFFLSLDNPIDCIMTHLNSKNGIYYTHFYLNDYKNPKIQNFNVSYYEGLVKVTWEVLNERPGTKIILEKRSTKDTNWKEVYSYNSNLKLTSKLMSYDDQVLDKEKLKYRIRLINPEGMETIFEEEIVSEKVPEGFFLYQNSPNPFSASTKIVFRLPIKSRVLIKLYNSRLEEIGVIFDEVRDAGLHEIEFIPLPDMESGIYFYRISASGFYDVKKMIYTK